jgi:hypothetical protein
MCSGSDVLPLADGRHAASGSAFGRLERLHEAGVPVATVDAGRLANVVWQFTIPASTACSADVTIDDVLFY